MKLHRNLALAVIAALDSIFEKGEVAEKVVEQTISANPKWGKRDRSFFAQTTYEIVRWKRLFEFSVGSEAPHALLFAQLVRAGFEIPAWPEFAGLNADTTRENLARRDLPFAVSQSIPNWFDDLGREEIGARWEEEMTALNEGASVVVRANSLRISREELQRELAEKNIASAPIEGVASAPIEGVASALVLAERPNLKPFLSAGILEIQDAASQMVAPFLAPQNGELVIDACAGAGGKSLHLAALAPEARIVALDVSRAKLGELQRRAERGGAQNIEIRAVENSVLKRLKGQADRLLIDAPCSGTGTMRRQSSLKWRLSPEFLAEVVSLQRDILERYQLLLKPGGTLVYATCSIFPRENERQVEWFLAQNPGYTLEEMRAISPRETGFDGFFMARMKKQAD